MESLYKTDKAKTAIFRLYDEKLTELKLTF